MIIEKIKENLLNQILEVESDMKILSERISVLKSEIPKAETEKEIDRITFDLNTTVGSMTVIATLKFVVGTKNRNITEYRQNTATLAKNGRKRNERFNQKKRVVFTH